MSEEVSEEVATEEVVETTEEVSNEKVQETESSNNFVDTMLSQIEDEDVKSAGFWKNLEGKGATEVGKYIKELQSFAGKKGDIPKKDASEEEWSAFYQKLGRPENIEGYDFGLNDDFKELVGEDAMPYFNQAVNGFKEKAFEMGANSDQAEEMLDWYLSLMADTTTEQKNQLQIETEKKDNELKKAWGDSYEGMERGIEALLRSNGMEDEHIEWAKSSGILKEPTLAIALGNIAAKFDDDPEIGHHQTKTLAGLEDQFLEAQAEFNEYFKKDGKAPAHVLKKYMDLNKTYHDAKHQN
jgi:hypothetical protein